MLSQRRGTHSVSVVRVDHSNSGTLAQTGQLFALLYYCLVFNVERVHCPSFQLMAAQITTSWAITHRHNASLSDRKCPSA